MQLRMPMRRRNSDAGPDAVWPRGVHPALTPPARLAEDAGMPLVHAFVRLSILFFFAAVAPAEEGVKDLAAELPRIKPLAPEEALSSFAIASGFRIELAACEPEVVDPVAAAFDEDGRLFVAEMRDYPFSLDAGNMTRSDEARTQPSGRVRLLEDRDGDGRFEKGEVFADGFHWPTAVAVWKGGVFVASAPDILYLRDEDRDGRADSRDVVWTGFGRGNVQALLNNLKWGIDNYLYGAGGGNEGEITPGRLLHTGAAVRISIRGRDFRFKPGSSGFGEFDAIPAGGQFGLSFNEWGDRFVCSNSNHLRHAVLPGRALDRRSAAAGRAAVADIAEDGPAARVFRRSPPEPWRVVRTRWRAAAPDAKSRYIPTELVPVGFFTSASGVTIYRGDAFPSEFRGNAFVGDVGGNLVHRKILERRGPTFAARRPESEATSEFLTSTDTWFRPVNFAEGPDGCLYILDMYRETIEHPFSIPDSIKKHLSLTSGNDRGRIWRIAPVGFQHPPPRKLSGSSDGELVDLLRHGNAWHRETGQRLIIDPRRAKGAREGVEKALIRLAGDREAPPLGRIHALSTLSGLDRLQWREIAEGLKDSDPRVREHAVQLAASDREKRPETLAALQPLAADGDSRVRFQLALALGDFEGDVPVPALAALAAGAKGDAWIETAVLSASAGREVALLERLPKENTVLVRPLAETSKEEKRLVAWIAIALREKRTESALRAFAGWGDGRSRTAGPLSKVLEDPPNGWKPIAEDLKPLRDAAIGSLRAETIGMKLLGIEAFAHLPFSDAESTLPGLIDAREPPSVQLAAVRALSAHPGPAVGRLLVAAWTRASPDVRRELLEAIFNRPERYPALLDAVEEGEIPARSVSTERRKQLYARTDPPTRARALSLLGVEPASDRREAIESMRGALKLEGEVERGRVVYRRACATCHRLAGEGHAVGPDLESVRDRTPEALLDQILDPSRELLPAYSTFFVQTRDGRALTGLVATENETTMTLRRAEGVEELVLRSGIREVQDTGLSLMPEGLEQELRPQDLADVIALLRGGGGAK